MKRKRFERALEIQLICEDWRGWLGQKIIHRTIFLITKIFSRQTAISCKFKMTRNAIIKKLSVFNYFLLVLAIQSTYFNFQWKKSSRHSIQSWMIHFLRLATNPSGGSVKYGKKLKRSLLTSSKVRLLLDFKCVCNSIYHTQSFLRNSRKSYSTFRI